MDYAAAVAMQVALNILIVALKAAAMGAGFCAGAVLVLKRVLK